MIHSKKHSDILKITLVLQMQKLNVLMQFLPLKILLKLLNLVSEVIELIKTLNIKKASQKSNIPTKVVKLNADFFGNLICKNFHYCLKKGELPRVLKHADVIPVHRKKIKSDKANYRPVGILLNLSNLFMKS